VKRTRAKAGVESDRKGAQGASLDEIGEVLRHRSPDTTAIYAKVALDALRMLALLRAVMAGRWPDDKLLSYLKGL